MDQSLTGPTILRSIQEQGFQGSRSTLSQYIADLRRLRRTGGEPSPRFRHVSPRSAAKILTKPRDKVDDEDRPYLKRLLSNVEGTVVVRNLAISFYELMKQSDEGRLNEWLAEAKDCGVRELQRFARGIQKDYSAIAAGIAEPWSNGQVEGQINRLKTLKRQMYGRAGFELLRARVLYHG